MGADHGSSPRMWGTGVFGPLGQADRRFIPTYVGNRCCGWRHRCRSAVHPHVCGEQDDAGTVERMKAGSSPRMWGTASSSHAHTSQSPVHPHVCGEQISASTRMARSSRFIPTYVGNSGPVMIDALPKAVHPHVCGEQVSPSSRPVSVSGSSPRMWGTGPSRASIRFLLWFIPTYVGNSSSTADGSNPGAVHPHVCGEQGSQSGDSHVMTGSSPRMWGTVNRRALVQSENRFIPTYVGNRADSRVVTASASVHPHVCGEQDTCTRGIVMNHGSSPRMWGTVPDYRSGNWL